MTTLSAPTLLFWVLISLVILGSGIILLVRGLTWRFRGSEPHCRKCHYNLTGVSAEVCPECGVARTAASVVRGERYRRPGLLAVGVALALLGIGSCLPLPYLFKSRPAARPASVTNNVRNAKLLIADMNATCKAGQAEYDSLGVGGQGIHDRRMPILVLLVKDKIKVSIQRYVPKPAVQAAALTELKAAEQLLDTQIIPAHYAARRSKEPADAQALVPLMNHLDKHMDKLLTILKGL